MIIKDSDSRSLARAGIRRLVDARFASWLRLFVLIAVATLFLVVGVLLERTGFYGRVLKPMFSNRYYFVNAWKGYFSSPEHLTIDIAFKDYQRLRYNRDIALQRRVLLPDYRDEVPATIRYGDQSLKATVRLKGDLPDHWDDEYKWSLRVRLKGGATLFGMEEFSLNNPKTRSYANEWLFHELLKAEGFAALRYDFVQANVNGRDLGVYALEENFDKHLIEHNRRREGPILRFDDYLYWDGTLSYNGGYFAAPVVAFEQSQILKDPALRREFMIAKNLLEAFRRGDLTVAKTFDMTRLAQLFAICDLMGRHHATHFHDIRFYYNPVTSILEPIGFDNQYIFQLETELMEGEDTERSNWEPDSWIARLLSDQEFFAAYIKELQRLTSGNYLDEFVSATRVPLQERLDILHKDYPWYEFDAVPILYHNQEYIRTRLHPARALLAHLVTQHERKVELELSNIHTLPVEVTGLLLDSGVSARPMEHILLNTRNPLSPVRFETHAFELPTGMIWHDSLIAQARVSYRVLGTETELYADVTPWSEVTEGFLQRDLMRQPFNVDQFEFLSMDSSERRITVLPGHWRLNKNLLIPPGYTVVCGGGTSIDLTDSAIILSYSPLRFAGTEDDPIVIGSEDSTGQGLAVIRAGGFSSLEHVHFVNLANPARSGWSLTGAVTFYESPVQCSYCVFRQNRCEDALNVIRSECLLSRTLFLDTQSDALDWDFVKGTVSECTFVNCGNDGVDVSGSDLTLERVRIDGAGDKGVSIGEDSHARADSLEVMNTEVALASKDKSDFTVGYAHISHSKVAFAVYQKKPEFGEARLAIGQCKLEAVEEPFLLEQGSILELSGIAQLPNQDRVKSLLYGVKFGKASK